MTITNDGATILKLLEVEHPAVTTNWVRELTAISALMFIDYSASPECPNSVSNTRLYTRQTKKRSTDRDEQI